MIKYIQKKNVDYTRLKEILTISEERNQFCNRGPVKFLLEKKISSLLELPGNKAVICTANGTLALHALFLFYRKRGIKKFSSPSFTFPSCNVGGFKTEIVDISLDNYSFGEIEKITEKSDCLIVTNLFGTYPHNLVKMIEECNKRGKKIILDNASSPLTKISGNNICTLGDASFGSLHHTKFLGFGEGGFIVIDKEHEEEINTILGFGFTGKTAERISDIHSSNFKISDVSAAAILQHIERYDLKKHIENQTKIIESLEKIGGVEVFNYSDEVFYGNIPIIYDKPMSTYFFRDNYLEAQKYYYPIKKHKNSLHLYNRMINLPIHATMNDYEIETIIKIVRNSVNA